MAMTENAKEYIDRMLGGVKPPLLATDPEFIERFANFAYDEVVNEEGQQLDDPTRFMAILATLLGCQGVDLFRSMLPAAINFGVTPIAAREIVYQATAYLGLGRTLPFIQAMNETFAARGIQLPLEDQGTTTRGDRVEKGEAAQVEIFGEGMKGFAEAGPEGRKHINRWLSGNCFGDYYTRGGLTLAQREMVTFCYIAAQGGCEPQLVAHAAGNLNMGNDAAFLVRVVSQCLPFIGYPRSLNALAAIDKAAAAGK